MTSDYYLKLSGCLSRGLDDSLSEDVRNQLALPLAVAFVNKTYTPLSSAIQRQLEKKINHARQDSARQDSARQDSG